MLSWYVMRTKSACLSLSGENSSRLAVALRTMGAVVSSWILFGRRIVWCCCARWIFGADTCRRALAYRHRCARPSGRSRTPPREHVLHEDPHKSPVRAEHLDGDGVGAAQFDHDVRVPASAAARWRERLRHLRPGMSGLFVSFSRSVIAKAAAVATSRPTRVTVVRSRCNAPRFYGSRVRIRLKRASSMLPPVTIRTSGRGSDSRSASASGAAAAPSARIPASA